MNKGKWTRSPWYVHEREIENPNFDYFPNGVDGFIVSTGCEMDWCIAAVIGNAPTPNEDDDAGKANAHLIAASPDLYEALHNARVLLKALTGPDDEIAQATIRSADAALAKARGEQQ